MNSIPQKKSLGVFSLVMINIIAVDSIRSLPFSAEYGFSIIFYYLIGALVFFLPIAFFSAELATGWPKKGGIYVWVREAFGEKIGFLTIWLQWVYNIVWYPTILSLIAGALAFLIHPSLASSKTFILTSVLIIYWAATFLNFFGMKLSSRVSTVGALLGTLFPMLFIIGLGAFWIFSGNPSMTPLNAATFIPDFSNINHLVFLTAVLFGLIGMEMSAVHADEVQSPHKAYPKAILISSIIILLTLIGGSLSIAIAVPAGSLNIITGLLEAYKIFLDQFHLGWMAPIMDICIIIGGISGVSAWIIGPSKGMLIAAKDGAAPKIFQKVNSKGVPVNLLWTQGIIFTLLCSIYLLLPTVSSSYWLLSAMTAQLAVLVYIGLFAAGIVLRYKKPNMQRDYKIPGGNILIIIMGALGISCCVFTFILGFFPPSQIPVGNLWTYECILLAGTLAFIVTPFFLQKKSHSPS